MFSGTVNTCCTMECCGIKKFEKSCRQYNRNSKEKKNIFFSTFIWKMKKLKTLKAVKRNINKYTN